jgi:hypothetical protein
VLPAETCAGARLPSGSGSGSDHRSPRTTSTRRCGSSRTPQIEDTTARSGEGQVGGLQQFATCPWCGTSLDLGRDGRADKARRRILLFCGDADGRCPFSRSKSNGQGLPALVVDEEIYRLTPALLIGTVDKFAALPWRSSTAHLFGRLGTRG